MPMNTRGQWINEGYSLDRPAGSAVTAGSVIQIAGRAGLVPTGGIAASTLGAIISRGLAKIAAKAEAGSAGNVVFWDNDGNPYGGVAGSGALTLRGADGDFVVGSLAWPLLATDGAAFVLLNEFAPDQPFFPGFTYLTKSANYSVLITDFGSVIQVDTDAVVITMPTYGATMDGGNVVVQNIAADGAALVSISPIAADKIKGAGWAGVDDKDARNTKATAKCGDFMELNGDGVDGWFIRSKRGVWAAEA
jgi:hypothetical protein